MDLSVYVVIEIVIMFLGLTGIILSDAKEVGFLFALMFVSNLLTMFFTFKFI